MATLTARPYTEADIPAIVELINRCEAVDQVGLSTTLNEMHVYLSKPGLEQGKNIQLWEDAQGQLLAYSDVTLDAEEAVLVGAHFFVLDPAHRGEGIEEQIAAWARDLLLRAAAERGLAPRYRVGAHERDRWRSELFERLGAPTRIFFRMRRDLTQPLPEPQIPAGYTIRPLREDELGAWRELHNQAFGDHWGFYPMDAAEARSVTLDSPAYRPQLSLVAEAADGALAAFCHATISQEEIARLGLQQGHVELLGTHPTQRGAGLGRAILLAAMHGLREAGMTHVRLGVDTDSSTGAPRLYDSVGYEVISRFRIWLRDLDAAQR